MRPKLFEEEYELETAYRERMHVEPHLPEPVGKQPKYWIISNGKRYLFKLATYKSHDGSPIYNDVSECMASDIAEMLYLPCARYMLCENKGEKGVLTPDFLDNETIGPKKEEFVDGVYLINQIDEGFKNTSLMNPKTKQYYTVDLILRSVEKYGLMQDAINMLVYDALIGNRDRNPSNYGIILNHETGEYRFAPLYDNGTSLGISMVDHRLSACIDESGNIINEEQLNEVIHNQILGKVTLDRFFQYKEKKAWDFKEMTRIANKIEEKKHELREVVASRRMSEQAYHEILFKIGKERRTYDIANLEYQTLIAYLTNHYPEYIEGIMEMIKQVVTPENIDRLFNHYSEELPPDRLKIAKEVVLRRGKWMVEYYYNNRLDNGGYTL